MAHLKLFDGRDWKWFPGKITPYRYGNICEKMERKKASALLTLERNIINIFFDFLTQKKQSYQNSCKRTSGMQR